MSPERFELAGCREPYFTAELLFSADGSEAGWWSPSAHGLRMPTRGEQRPEGLAHLKTTEELCELGVAPLVKPGVP